MDLETRRRYAKEWCDFAANGDSGRRVTDPVYQAIVEGRDKGPNYSSCGDLAHWLLYRLGCRETNVNREENGGWAVGRNVSHLAWWSIARPWPPEPVTRENLAKQFATGDIIILWRKPDTTDAHVCIFDRVEGGLVHTWDAGQGPMSVAAWTGNFANPIELCRRARLETEFHVKRFISLEKVPWAAEPELPSGEAFDAMEGL